MMALFSNLFSGHSTDNDAPQLEMRPNPIQEAQQLPDNNVDVDINITHLEGFQTGLPIDKLYEYIERDWESIGENDGNITPDISFMQSKLKHIGQGLMRRFELVEIIYNQQIIKIESHIETLTALGLLDSVNTSKAILQIYKTHIEKIESMKKNFLQQDQAMTTMLQSYENGFKKGVSKHINSLFLIG